MIANISDCCSELITAWPKIKTDFENLFIGWRMKLICCYRSVEEQQALFKIGREYNIKTGKWVRNGNIITNCDGVYKMSPHNSLPSKAFDVALKGPNNIFMWDTLAEQWQFMPTIALRFGLENGGSWKSFKDYPHFQVAA